MTQTPIIDHLAALRRYARFLCGSAAEGDLLVLSTLQACRAGEGGDLSRLGLFKALHRHWIPIDGPATPARDRLDMALAALSPQQRAVLLLCGFEGFSLQQAAAILEADPAELAIRLDRARISAALTRPCRVLIVEDEALTARMLEQLVGAMGFEPMSPASSRAQAVAAAACGHPDLILSDIELGSDGSGIDAVREIRESIDVPVVFVTAFPHRVRDWDLCDNTFLVRKPLNRMALTSCIRRAMAGG
ncbi:response regulator [Glycocaulis profundi]|nr:response regulator [Glycocaulis profundi]